MHIQRFWWYVLLCLVFGWAVSGFYPSGIPVFDPGKPTEIYTFPEFVQAVSWLAINFGGLLGIIISLFIFFELLRTKTVNEAHALGARRAGALSKAAPFGLAFAVLVVVAHGLQYARGEVSGLMAAARIGGGLFLIIAIVIAVRTAIFLAPEKRD